MSCRDTGGPTQGSSPTSVPYVRRSLPAVTTFQNTSKSTVFLEAAGQFAQQTDAPLRSLGMLGSLSYRHRPREQGVSLCIQVCVQIFVPSSSQYEYVSGSTPCFLFQQSVIVLIYCTEVNQHSYHLVCNQLKVVVAVGAFVCCTPYVCSALISAEDKINLFSFSL